MSRYHSDRLELEQKSPQFVHAVISKAIKEKKTAIDEFLTPPGPTRPNTWTCYLVSELLQTVGLEHCWRMLAKLLTQLIDLLDEYEHMHKIPAPKRVFIADIMDVCNTMIHLEVDNLDRALVSQPGFKQYYMQAEEESKSLDEKLTDAEWFVRDPLFWSMRHFGGKECLENAYSGVTPQAEIETFHREISKHPDQRLRIHDDQMQQMGRLALLNEVRLGLRVTTGWNRLPPETADLKKLLSSGGGVVNSILEWMTLGFTQSLPEFEEIASGLSTYTRRIFKHLDPDLYPLPSQQTWQTWISKNSEYTQALNSLWKGISRLKGMENNNFKDYIVSSTRSRN